MVPIGIAGKARSGKDTLAKYLAGHKGIQQYAFAEPIKAVINALFDWDIRHAEGELKETPCEVMVLGLNILAANMTASRYGLDDYGFDVDDLMKVLGIKSHTLYEVIPRVAYQRFGTEYGRDKLSPTIWIDIAPKENVIISDVRFENESSMIRDNGGYIIHLSRDNVDNVDMADRNHVSEAGVEFNPGDINIKNEGSLDDFIKTLSFVFGK